MPLWEPWLLLFNPKSLVRDIFLVLLYYYTICYDKAISHTILISPCNGKWIIADYFTSTFANIHRKLVLNNASKGGPSAVAFSSEGLPWTPFPRIV